MRTALACFLAIALAGCLEFDAQEVHLQHDTEQDRLDVMLVYRGLFAESGNVAEALAHWDEAMDDGDFAFWNNWPLKVETEIESNNQHLLKKFISVENGSAFTDPTGTLCAYQFLRVRKVSELLTTVNGMLNLAVPVTVLGGGRPLNHRFDAETRELVQEHIRAREPWVALDGAAIRIQLPCSLRDHTALMKIGAKALFEGIAVDIRDRVLAARIRVARDEAPDTAPDYSALRPASESPEFSLDELEVLSAASAYTSVLTDNPWSLVREEERTVFVLGLAGHPDQVLRKASSGRYQPALLDEMRAQQRSIEDGVPDQELARRFEDFRGRDPVLPKDYAEMLGNK